MRKSTTETRKAVAPLLVDLGFHNTTPSGVFISVIRFRPFGDQGYTMHYRAYRGGDPYRWSRRDMNRTTLAG